MMRRDQCIPRKRVIPRGKRDVACAGYGVDSLTVGLVAICSVKFAGETRDAVVSLYPATGGAVITNASPLRSPN